MLNIKQWLIIYTLSIFIITIPLYAANLEHGQKTQSFLSNLKARKNSNEMPINDTKLMKGDRVSDRPVAYRITKKEFAASELSRLATVSGFSAISTVENNGVFLSTNKDASIGFDAETGNYFMNHYDRQLKPLTKSSAKDLAALRIKADKALGDLLGQDAKNFVFANDETDWIETIDNHIPRIAAQYYRYTRKINGGHVIDNTSFVRIGFSGDMELSSFGIANPDLQPVRLDDIVLPASIENRLSEHVKKMEPMISGESKQNIKKVTTNWGIDSYKKMTTSRGALLIPHVSFWSDCELENAEKFSTFISLPLDRSLSPNEKSDSNISR